MTTRSQAQTVDCPACYAKAGATCTQPTELGRRPVDYVHVSREGAYERTPGTVISVDEVAEMMRAAGLRARVQVGRHGGHAVTDLASWSVTLDHGREEALAIDGLGVRLEVTRDGESALVADIESAGQVATLAATLGWPARRGVSR